MTPSSDTVVLLHGIAKGPMDVFLASLYMRKHGYRTFSPRYSVHDGGIEKMADRVWRDLEKQNLVESAGRIHFVAHSLGGLVSHDIIRRYKPNNLGRVVMWGTPLQGCDYADSLNNSSALGPLFRLIYKQAGQEVMIAFEDPERAVPLSYPAGVIAGTTSFNPTAGFFLKDAGQHDGIVPLKRTQREGLADHLAMDVSHINMPFSPSVLRQTAHFLKHGQFLRLS